jgi:hypothetical protein
VSAIQKSLSSRSELNRKLRGGRGARGSQIHKQKEGRKVKCQPLNGTSRDVWKRGGVVSLSIRHWWGKFHLEKQLELDGSELIRKPLMLVNEVEASFN